MAAFYDYPALVASGDNQRLQLDVSASRSFFLAQFFANRSNAGTIWLGGSSVAQNRGLPIYAGSLMFIPPLPNAAVLGSSVYLFFEKNGDILYTLGVVA